MGFAYTFKKDGIMVARFEEEAADRVWWIENGQRMVAGASVLRYSIWNGERTFTAVGEGYNTDLSDHEFRADRRRGRLQRRQGSFPSWGARSIVNREE